MGKTACFSGHRSQKLPWRFNESDPRCVALKERLRAEIENAIERGYTTFLCGMAIGFDTYCAEAVLDLKKKHGEIELIGALPCRTQDASWREEDKIRYRDLLERLDGIRCIYDEYVGTECMHERNRYMVDSSSLVIALYGGRAGGTKSTVDYAYFKGVEVKLIEVDFGGDEL